MHGVRMLLGLATLAALAPPSGARDAPRPNIVVLVADDLGYGDLGSYGNRDFETPALDRLADQGMRFTQFYANASICTPTRMALLTGQYPQRQGSRFPSGFTSFQGLPGDVETLPRVLQRAGYRTHHVGKWHVGHRRPEFHPMSRGFDGFFGFLHQGELPNRFSAPFLRRDWGEPVRQSLHLTDALGQEAVAFLRQPHPEPFFLQVWFFAPHAPVQPPARWAAQIHNDYFALTSALDENIGLILDALRDEGLEQDTLVLFLSDNGSARPERNGGLRGAKWSNFEGGQRVPFVARWPGHIPAGGVSDAVAAGFDLFPTLVELAGADASRHQVDGTSLLGVLLEGRPLRSRELFWETLSRFALRRGDWKLVRSGVNNVILDDEPLRLFHLGDDPEETQNLAALHPEIVERLEHRYQQLRRATREIDYRLSGSSGSSGSVKEVGNGFVFQPPGGDVRIAHDVRLDVTDAEFSVAFWALPSEEASPGLQILMTRPGSWGLLREPDGRLVLLLGLEDGGLTGVRSTRSVEAERWTHVVVTQTRRRLGTMRTLVVRLYLDGALDRSFEYHDTNPLVVNDEDLLVASATAATAPYLGSVAELRFFNDDLTPDEIAALAGRHPGFGRHRARGRTERGAALSPPCTGTPPGRSCRP